MAHILLVVMPRLSLFSCHCCYMIVLQEFWQEGGERDGSKGSLCCTSCYYFKYCSDCKGENVIYLFIYVGDLVLCRLLIHGSLSALSSRSPLHFPCLPAPAQHTEAVPQPPCCDSYPSLGCPQQQQQQLSLLAGSVAGCKAGEGERMDNLASPVSRIQVTLLCILIFGQS